MMRPALLLLFVTFFFSCGKDEAETTPPKVTFVFEDSFEAPQNDLDNLFPENGSRWTAIQQVDPNGATNEIGIVVDPVSNGTSALRLFSNPSNEILSKIDIEKGGFQAFSQSTVTIKADFYIATSETIANLILIDLECRSCWDPSVVDNQSPGIRLKISEEGDYLSIERGKIVGATIAQAEYAFPRNRWVTVVWEMTLSDGEDGMNSLRIDGNEVISSLGMNLPNATIFRDTFAENDIDFSLQEPVFYERVQIGATANPTAGAVEMFVDDFSLSIE